MESDPGPYRVFGNWIRLKIEHYCIYKNVFFYFLKICLRLESREKLELFTKFEEFPGKFSDVSELKVGSRYIQNDMDQHFATLAYSLCSGVQGPGGPDLRVLWAGAGPRLQASHWEGNWLHNPLVFRSGGNIVLDMKVAPHQQSVSEPGALAPGVKVTLRIFFF